MEELSNINKQSEDKKNGFLYRKPKFLSMVAGHRFELWTCGL